jgi:gamma-glutamylcyclotransferase (GGCT)/AIG2-like uncharacterized protein YtfP
MNSTQVINKFFVYGTLRPDILSPWSKIVYDNKDFKVLKNYKSYLPFSKLYIKKNIKYPFCVHNKTEYSEKDITLGYILEFTNIEKALKQLDHIENYPTLYDRKVVSSFNEELSILEEVYLYTSPDLSELELIDYNDWKLFINK